MAAAVVRGYALRLHLSAGAALRNGGNLEDHWLLAGEGLSLLHLAAVRDRDRGSVSADAGRDGLARDGVPGRGCDLADVAHFFVHAAISRGRVEAAASAA